MREFRLIDIASQIFRVEWNDVLVGAGDDDCAVVRLGSENVVLTADNLHEKADFPPSIKPEEIGHLSLAVNLSDLAGSGAEPRYFLYTITIRDGIDDEFYKKILEGMKKLADKYRVAVVGGDTDFGDELSIAGFAVGVAKRFVTQKGALPGEKVCLTGELGKAQLSLEQLFSGAERGELAYPESLFTPEPRVGEGVELAQHASAMTDISDSLAISLNLIAKKSSVGIIIYEELLNLQHLTDFVDYEKALELYLYAGGDYELVYTSDDCSHGFVIGEVIKGEGVYLETENGLKEVEFRGYSHM
jgi:thiamine-monophosphate kinase